MLSFNRLGRLGRLGNQMFQYAALFAIARKAGTDFCIPQSDAADPRRDHQLFLAFTLPQLKFRRRQEGVPTLEEASFAYDERLHLGCPKDADLSGYFQSERYFADIADDIRREFSFRPEIVAHCRERLARFDGPTISLHLRRGDYVTAGDNHPLCSLDYYAAALEAMPGRIPVLVFSDDIAWCRAQPLFRGRRFFFVQNGRNYHDLCGMSLCSHHIIANSSFSWWGAWLGGNPEKIVVAPSRWFGETGVNARHDTKDLIPEGWLRL